MLGLGCGWRIIGLGLTSVIQATGDLDKVALDVTVSNTVAPKIKKRHHQIIYKI